MIENVIMFIDIHIKQFFASKKKELNSLWMVKDFNDFKVIKDWIDENRDHSYVYWAWDEVWEFLTEKWYRTYNMIVNPTAENMAEYLYNKFSNFWVNKVMVYETPTSLSIFKKDE